MAYPGGASANYLYFPNAQNKRLQQIKNLNSSKNNNLISQQDYTYDAEGEILTWTKNYASLSAPQRFEVGEWDIIWFPRGDIPIKPLAMIDTIPFALSPTVVEQLRGKVIDFVDGQVKISDNYPPG
ncbi:MAG: hypothetical protein DME97_00120 [Verrucomicrobia bacterium]|nr:MAG: hypothetical protein DME97_00120 [Verrucomicrobiota bacterium]